MAKIAPNPWELTRLARWPKRWFPPQGRNWHPGGTGVRIQKTVSPVPRKKKGLGPVGITMLLTFLHLFFINCCNLIETAINKRKHSGFFALKLELLVGETVKHGNLLREHSGQTGAFRIFVGGFPERLNLFYPWDVLFNY